MKYLICVIDDIAGLATPPEMAAIDAFNHAADGGPRPAENLALFTEGDHHVLVP